LRVVAGVHSGVAGRANASGEPLRFGAAICKRLNDEGTTIIQVTHNERNAEYGNRVINIADGWVANEVAGVTTPAPRISACPTVRGIKNAL